MHKHLTKLLAVMTGAVILYTALNFFHLFSFGNPWTSAWCDRGVLAEEDSPNGTLTARAVYFVCGALSTDYWTAVVLVKKGKKPSMEDEVLIADIRGEPIQLRWKAGDQLEIAVSPASYISRRKSEHSGVKVELTGPPPGPAE